MPKMKMLPVTGMIQKSVYDILTENFTDRELDKSIKLMIRINYNYYKNRLQYDQWLSLSRKYFRRALTSQYTHLVGKIKELGILECNESYSTTYSISKKYKYATQHCDSDYVKVTYRDSLKPEAKNHSNTINTLKLLSFPDGFDVEYETSLREDYYRSKIMKNIDVNNKVYICQGKSKRKIPIHGEIDDYVSSETNKILNNLKMSLYKIVNKEHDNHCSRNKTNRRMDHLITNLPKHFRHKLLINGEYMVLIDLSCSQFSIFSNFIYQIATKTNIFDLYKGYNIDIELSILIDTINSLLPPKMWYVKTKDDINEYFDGFIDDAVLKDIYRTISHKMKLADRDAGKNCGFGILFGTHYKEASKTTEAIRKVYPIILEIIDKIKEKFIDIEYKKANVMGYDEYKKKYKKSPVRIGSSKFSITLQKIESIIFIDNLLKYLEENGIKVVPCHDAIMVPISQKDQAIALMESVLVKYLPYGYTLKVELKGEELEKIVNHGQEFIDSHINTDIIIADNMPKHKGFNQRRPQSLYNSIEK
ncbi:MAG: hypothetical protein H6567_10085 [Lewinellaceae bacterium]|nr:hypothetical protein [Lewinellaceae bacterium]